MKNEPGVFEIIHGTRAMRRLKPDPVPDEVVQIIRELPDISSAKVVRL